MKIKRLSAEFTVSTQLEVAKVAKVAKRGYAAIICNRPDGEGQGQPDFADIAAEARRHGIEARYLPISLNGEPQRDLAECLVAIDELPKPIFAYCRSGTRSATLLRKYRMRG